MWSSAGLQPRADQWLYHVRQDPSANELFEKMATGTMIDPLGILRSIEPVARSVAILVERA